MTHTPEYLKTLDYILSKYDGWMVGRGRPDYEITNTGRIDLAILFGELGFTTGAEIGVEDGIYSQTLCLANPALKLNCIDPWSVYTGYPTSAPVQDTKYMTWQEEHYQEAIARLKPYNCRLIRALSQDALSLFDNASLDFVYIDGNHDFPYVIDDLVGWSAKVRAGGIVSGHDYITNRYNNRDTNTCHVIPAVISYARAYRIRPWFILGTKAKTPGLVRDAVRSWFWVKEAPDENLPFRE